MGQWLARSSKGWYCLSWEMGGSLLSSDYRPSIGRRLGIVPLGVSLQLSSRVCPTPECIGLEALPAMGIVFMDLFLSGLLEAEGNIHPVLETRSGDMKTMDKYASFRPR